MHTDFDLVGFDIFYTFWCKCYGSAVFSLRNGTFLNLQVLGRCFRTCLLIDISLDRFDITSVNAQ